MNSVQSKNEFILIHIFLFIAVGECADLFLFTVDGETVVASPALLDPQVTTVLIIHGWVANATLPWIVRFGQLYHSVGNYNVLSLDWSQDADHANYAEAVIPIESVARAAVDEILSLFGQAGINLLKVHIMGHSLGAHVAGSITYILKSQYNLKIGRLTGFDVAGPLYEYPIPNLTPYQFRKGRTIFTDAIHTSGMYVGERNANSDVDFYVNGGLLQAACGDTLLQLNDFSSCSHESSHIYYAQTILRPNSLIGCKNKYGVLGNTNNKCVGNQYAPMGEFVPSSSTGVYWVNTNASVTDVGL